MQRSVNEIDGTNILEAKRRVESHRAVSAVFSPSLLSRIIVIANSAMEVTEGLINLMRGVI